MFFEDRLQVRNACKLARLVEVSMDSTDSIFRGPGCRPLALIKWPKNGIWAHLNLHHEGQSHGHVAGQHWDSYHDRGHHIHTQQCRLQFQWHRVNLQRFHPPSFRKCLEYRLTQKVNTETCTFQKANYTANFLDPAQCSSNRFGHQGLRNILHFLV